MINEDLFVDLNKRGTIIFADIYGSEQQYLNTIIEHILLAKKIKIISKINLFSALENVMHDYTYETFLSLVNSTLGSDNTYTVGSVVGFETMSMCVDNPNNYEFLNENYHLIKWRRRDKHKRFMYHMMDKRTNLKKEASLSNLKEPFGSLPIHRANLLDINAFISIQLLLSRIQCKTIYYEDLFEQEISNYTITPSEFFQNFDLVCENLNLLPDEPEEVDPIYI